MPPPVVIVLLALAGFGCLVASYRSNRKRRLIEALPTSATQGVFIGLVEVKGTAESERPLRTYLAECQAVYYRWSVTEHWERWVTETYVDDKGKTRTRQRRESGWSTVASGGDSQPFYLADETGAILVRPDGADVRGVGVFNEYCGRGNPLYYAKGPRHAVANSTHRRHFHETAIVLHEELYIVGRAREREDIIAAEIAADKAVPLFLVTAESEEQVRRRFGAGSVLWQVLGMILFGVGGFLLAGGAEGETGWIVAVAGVGAYLFLSGIGWLILVYNSLIDTRNRMKQGFSQIDVQLERRRSLIPNLVAVVEKAASHEREVLEMVAKLRAEAQATAPGLPGENPRSVIGNVRFA
ncbi:MAG: GIDE domain-containing protein [Verrucomicrobiota bacterium]